MAKIKSKIIHFKITFKIILTKFLKNKRIFVEIKNDDTIEQVVKDNMVSNIILHYPTSDLPVKWESSEVIHFKYKSAKAFVNELSKDVKHDKKCICNNTPHGIIFVQVERALGQYSTEEVKIAARCIIRDIVCYKKDVWSWIEDRVLLRMIKGITTCKYDKIFFEILKFNPLILVGRGIMYAILRYGTYGMMEAILDLCEDKVVGIESDDENDSKMWIQLNIIPILCEQPNSMRSEASDLLFSKHPMIATTYSDHDYSAMGLKIKDEVLLKYGSDLDEVLNSREKNTVWDREDIGVNDTCVIS